MEQTHLIPSKAASLVLFPYWNGSPEPGVGRLRKEEGLEWLLRSGRDCYTKYLLTLGLVTQQS
jgi:hypothetical protein